MSKAHATSRVSFNSIAERERWAQGSSVTLTPPLAAHKRHVCSRRFLLRLCSLFQLIGSLLRKLFLKVERHDDWLLPTRKHFRVGAPVKDSLCFNESRSLCVCVCVLVVGTVLVFRRSLPLSNISDSLCDGIWPRLKFCESLYNVLLPLEAITKSILN